MDNLIIGNCPICGQQDIPLQHYVDARGRNRIACRDEHACLAEYTRRRNPRPVESGISPSPSHPIEMPEDPHPPHTLTTGRGPTHPR